MKAVPGILPTLLEMICFFSTPTIDVEPCENLSGIEYGRGAERMKSVPPAKESTPAHRPLHRGAPGGGFGI